MNSADELWREDIVDSGLDSKELHRFDAVRAVVMGAGAQWWGPHTSVHEPPIRLGLSDEDAAAADSPPLLEQHRVATAPIEGQEPQSKVRNRGLPRPPSQQSFDTSSSTRGSSLRLCLSTVSPRTCSILALPVITRAPGPDRRPAKHRRTRSTPALLLPRTLAQPAIVNATARNPSNRHGSPPPVTPVGTPWRFKSSHPHLRLPAAYERAVKGADA